MHGNQQHSNGRIHEDVCVGKPGFMVVMVVIYLHVELLYITYYDIFPEAINHLVRLECDLSVTRV